MIEVIDLWKAFHARNILKGLNFSVKKGEFIAIRGKSGIGKTTLLKILGLLEVPDKGEVVIFNKKVSELKDNEKFCDIFASLLHQYEKTKKY